MNSILKKKYYTVSAVIVICYLIYLIFNFIKIAPCFHKPQSEFNEKRFQWLFKDSIFNQLDTFSLSFTNNENGIFVYDIQNKYRFLIWEFKGIKLKDLRMIKVSENTQLKGIVIDPAETPKLHNPELLVRYNPCLKFLNAPNINIGKGGKIIDSKNGENYYSLYGYMNDLCIENDRNEPQILFKYDEFQSKPSYYIFANLNGDFYFILINTLESGTLCENPSSFLNID